MQEAYIKKISLAPSIAVSKSSANLISDTVWLAVRQIVYDGMHVYCALYDGEQGYLNLLRLNPADLTLAGSCRVAADAGISSCTFDDQNLYLSSSSNNKIYLIPKTSFS